MLAMANSLKTNDAVLAARTRDTINESNRNFAARQKAHAEVMASYDAQNQAWRDRQVSSDKRAADFGEALRGYRTVEDTMTGEQKEVPLGDAKDIVDTLNEGDPGRFKEIPARDMVGGP
jgi:hypothetical protein